MPHTAVTGPLASSLQRKRRLKLRFMSDAGSGTTSTISNTYVCSGSDEKWVEMFQITDTYGAFDGQIFTAIDCRAYGDEIFLSRLGAQSFQGYACE